MLAVSNSAGNPCFDSDKQNTQLTKRPGERKE